MCQSGGAKVKPSKPKQTHKNLHTILFLFCFVLFCFFTTEEIPLVLQQCFLYISFISLFTQWDEEKQPKKMPEDKEDTPNILVFFQWNFIAKVDLV